MEPIRKFFNIKDLIMVIDDKSINIEIFHNGEGVNYDDPETFMNLLVTNLAFTPDEENPGKTKVLVTVSDEAMFIATPL